MIWSIPLSAHCYVICTRRQSRITYTPSASAIFPIQICLPPPFPPLMIHAISSPVSWVLHTFKPCMAASPASEIEKPRNRHIKPRSDYAEITKSRSPNLKLSMKSRFVFVFDNSDSKNMLQVRKTFSCSSISIEYPLSTYPSYVCFSWPVVGSPLFSVMIMCF